MCIYAATDILFIHLTFIEKEIKICSKKDSYVTDTKNRPTNALKDPITPNYNAILIYWKNLA